MDYVFRDCNCKYCDFQACQFHFMSVWIGIIVRDICPVENWTRSSRHSLDTWDKKFKEHNVKAAHRVRVIIHIVTIAFVHKNGLAELASLFCPVKFNYIPLILATTSVENNVMTTHHRRLVRLPPLVVFCNTKSTMVKRDISTFLHAPM